MDPTEKTRPRVPQNGPRAQGGRLRMAKKWGKLSKQKLDEIFGESECQEHDSDQPLKVMNKITTPYDLVQYALRKLGAPLVNIEVDDSQIHDILTDALALYSKQHFESLRTFFWTIRISPVNVKKGYVPFPPDVLEIIDVKVPSEGLRQSSDLLDNIPYQIFNQYSYSSTSSSATDMQDSLVFYQVSRMMVETLRSVFQSVVQFQWRELEKKLYLYKRLKVGTVLLIEGSRMVDPDDPSYDYIWNSAFLKKYVTALIGRQWGVNVGLKYKNVPASAGVTLDGEKILERYDAEVKEIERELRSGWEEPCRMFWG